MNKRNDYTMRPGKGSAIASSRHRMEDSQHSSSDAFVKKGQAAVVGMAGKNPNLKSEAMEFNAYMCNNGEHAQEFGRTLTSGLDKKAFPVK